MGGAGVEGEEIDSACDGRVRRDVLDVGVWGYTVFLIDGFLEGGPIGGIADVHWIDACFFADVLLGEFEILLVDVDECYLCVMMVSSCSPRMMLESCLDICPIQSFRARAV